MLSKVSRAVKIFLGVSELSTRNSNGTKAHWKARKPITSFLISIFSMPRSLFILFHLEGPKKKTLTPTNSNRKSKWKACLSTIFSPSSPNRLAWDCHARERWKASRAREAIERCADLFQNTLYQSTLGHQDLDTDTRQKIAVLQWKKYSLWLSLFWFA